MADIQVKVSRMKTWTAPDLDIIDSYQLWVTALHEHLVTLSNSDEPAAERWDPSRVVDPQLEGLDQEGTPEGNNTIQLPSNNQPLNNILDIVVAKMSWHVVQYISRTQEGVVSDTRWAKRGLLVVFVVLQSLETVRPQRPTSDLLGLTTRKPTTQHHIHWNAWNYIKSTRH